MRVKQRTIAAGGSLTLAFALSSIVVCGQTAPPSGSVQINQGPAVATAAGATSNPGRTPMAAVGVPVLGMPFVHDPSTVVRFKGRYYVFSTGRGAPFYSSPDGVTWTREGSVFQQIPDDVHMLVPKNNGMDVWAPDIVRINGMFYLYYAVSSWGSFQSAVALATNPVLDPKDPAYHWTSHGVVITSDGTEDLNAIDPGVIHAPDGTLWICYGSYHGSIRVTQLDPKSGLALHPQQLGAPVATARESEASDIIFHDGYYYLFVNHGSCCKGRVSEYNIRVGRAKNITGPYLDQHGDPLASGGGSLFLAAHDHRIGPGHFGRLLDYDRSPDGNEGGPERFSVHYEADMMRGNRSVLDIRPLLWSVDGWPIAGDNLAEGVYQMRSRQSENILEQRVPLPPQPARGANGPPGASTGASENAAPNLTPAAPELPTLRLARYLSLDSQKWVIGPAGNGAYKIVDAGTGLALQVANDGAVGLGGYTGATTQMWNVEQYPNGGYRISSQTNGLSLNSVGTAVVALGEFKYDDLHLWTITTP